MLLEILLFFVWLIVEAVALTFSGPHDSFWAACVAAVLGGFLILVIAVALWFYEDADPSEWTSAICKHVNVAGCIMLFFVVPHIISVTLWAQILVHPQEWWRTNPVLIVWTPVVFSALLLHGLSTTLAKYVTLFCLCCRGKVTVKEEQKQVV